MSQHDQHVVFGAGPLGTAVARQLAARGHEPRLVSRSGRAEVPDAARLVAADASDPDAARHAAAGADVIYHCAQPPYGQWRAFAPALTHGILAAAESNGAKLVYGDNLYMYGPVTGPIHEDLPYAAAGRNGRVRAELARSLLAAHEEGRVRTVIGRASDFYGPNVRTSSVGENVFGPVLEGKPARLLGDPDQPHTLTFIDDFAAALVTLGQDDTAFGRAWHVPSAPPVTRREFVALVREEAGTGPTGRIVVAPSFALAILGLWNPTMRALRESLYQSEQPWVVDHGRYAARYGDHATPLREGIRATLEWYRHRTADSAATRGAPRPSTNADTATPNGPSPRKEA